MIFEEDWVKPLVREQTFVLFLSLFVDIFVDMFFLRLDGANDVFFVVDGFEVVGVILKFDLLIDKLFDGLDDIWLILPEWACETRMFFFLKDEGRPGILDVMVDEKHILVVEPVDYVILILLLYHHVVVVEVKV